MSFRSGLTGAVLVAAGALAAPSVVQAQASSRQDKDAADMKTLAAYRLTMPAVRKLAAAYENMMPLAADSAFARQVRDEQHPEGGASLDDMAAFFGRYPQVRAAITRAGLTPREFAIVNLSFMQASMVVGFADLAKEKGQAFDEAASGAPAANIAFVRANKSELDQVMARLNAFQEAQTKATREQRADDEEMPDESGEGEPPR